MHHKHTKDTKARQGLVVCVSWSHVMAKIGPGFESIRAGISDIPLYASWQPPLHTSKVLHGPPRPFGLPDAHISKVIQETPRPFGRGRGPIAACPPKRSSCFA